MTDARHTMMQFIILSVLLFGSVVSFEPRESALVEAVLSPSDKEMDLLNVSKKPSLQPKETPPLSGSFILKNRKGEVCVKAFLGVVFMVMENKKKLFFNMDPKSTTVTGYCGDQKGVLSLVFDGGNLEFTFIKENSVTYMSKLRASLEPDPTCKNCKPKTYLGIVDHENLFAAANGKSFMCKSETILILADSFRIKIVPLQIQAFDLSKGIFGKEVECWADYRKRITPIVVGAVIVGIILIAVLVYVLLRERRVQNYEQL